MWAQPHVCTQSDPLSVISRIGYCYVWGVLRDSLTVGWNGLVVSAIGLQAVAHRFDTFQGENNETNHFHARNCQLRPVADERKQQDMTLHTAAVRAARMRALKAHVVTAEGRHWAQALWNGLRTWDPGD